MHRLPAATTSTTARPIFGVDLDNVIAATDPVIRGIFLDMFGLKLQQADIVYYEYSRCGLTEEQEALGLARFHAEGCRRAEPVPGAIEALRVLRRSFEIHVVTSRPPDTAQLTTIWLQGHDIPYDRLDFVIRKAESAVPFAAFVDDNRDTAYAMVRRGVLSLLFEYPWNAPGEADPPGLIRVRSWAEIVAQLSRVSSLRP